jgi:large subunit ribosomal protein L10
MNSSEKTQVVEELSKTFQENGAVILLSFEGINVPDITTLRAQIREAGSHYRVVKNTLASLAASGTPVEPLKDQFTGPTAIAFSDSDPVGLAKILKAFVKKSPGLSFKAGVLEGKLLSVEQVENLADMASREELLSKVLFLLNAPLTRFATALKSPLRNLAYGLKQLAELKSE